MTATHTGRIRDHLTRRNGHDLTAMRTTVLAVVLAIVAAVAFLSIDDSPKREVPGTALEMPAGISDKERQVILEAYRMQAEAQRQALELLKRSER